ncbi:hypothetical protein OAB00_00645 [Akkermansiaceae bacterium]|nr:hypothetical protein [Akkermansiaceae bacterium]
MTKSEKKLLSILILLISLLLAVYVFTFIFNKKAELTQKRDLLKLESSNAKISLATREALDEQIQWLDELEPEPVDYNTATNEFQKFIASSSEPFGFKLIKDKVDTVTPSGHYRKVLAELEAKVTEEQLLKWLLALHAPKEFRAVTNLKLLPDGKEEDQIIAQVSVIKWVVENKKIEKDE